MIREKFYTQNFKLISMVSLEDLDKYHPYALDAESKNQILGEILFDLEKYHPTAYKKLNDHKNNFYYGIMCNNLKRGIAENVYKEDINIDILSRFRVSSIFLIFNPAKAAA